MVKKTVFGIIASRQQSENTVHSLQQAGFGTNDISALLPDKGGTRDFAHEQHTKAPEGALMGVGAGGAVGGTLGLLAGLGLLAVPGIGPFLAVGPIFAALGGAAVGAAAVGIVGGLVGMGVPELVAKQYEGKLRGGNILVSVHCENETERLLAKQVLETNGAKHIVSTGEAHVPTMERSL
jgi:hypothetical protein